MLSKRRREDKREGNMLEREREKEREQTSPKTETYYTTQRENRKVQISRGEMWATCAQASCTQAIPVPNW